MTDNEIKTRSLYLICHEGSEIGKDSYVGSTSQSLATRLLAHRSNASRPGGEANKFYKRMREVGLKNWVIRPLLSLESTICSRDDILRFERMWCEILRSDLNSVLPIRLSEKKSGPTMQTVYLLHNKNSETGKDSYVGSTSQSLERRLSDHKSHAKQKQNENCKLYKRILEVGLENWEIVPLLTLECTRDEIRAFEREWADLLEADLNSISPMATAEESSRRRVEYYASNREEIRKQQAEYRKKNREKIRQETAEYRKKNREKIRQETAEYRKKIKASKKFFCEICDITCCSKKELKTHNDTLKHQFAFLNSLD